MLIHIFRNSGNIEIRVALIGELFQFRIERLLKSLLEPSIEGSMTTYPSEADFISEVMKPTDAVFRILKVMVFDETESTIVSKAPAK